MRKINCGTSGSDNIPKTHLLSEIPTTSVLIKVLIEFFQKDLELRPAQDIAIFKHHFLQISDNVIIATPTNSGKSLLSYLLLLQEALAGNNVILIEPLRALAYEKAEELKKIVEIIQRQNKKIKIKITLTTGDYRLTDEFMHSKPSAREKNYKGQIIIATPERLDAISRIKENTEWFNSISLVCLDEAHLLGDTNRGATLELLLAYLRSLQHAPRIVLMSATITNADELACWLTPCQVIDKIPRYPKLNKWLYCVEDSEDVNTIIINEISNILANPNTSVIVFVYQTSSAENLAHLIAEHLSGQRIKKHDLSACMEKSVAWFHANLSTATKENIITEMQKGNVRVAVSTTALAMGINLPATHVFIRDLTFIGYKDLGSGDILQMMGRAGRGNMEGTGIVMISGNNQAKENNLKEELAHELLPKIQSSLIPIDDDDRYGRRHEDWFYVDRFGNQLMGILNRYGHISLTNIRQYLDNTLGGKRITNIKAVLDYLCRWKLAWLNEDTNEYEPTSFGRVASSSYISPITSANFGNLFRDLLEDAPDGEHVKGLSPIDYLIILCLTNPENKMIARYGKNIVDKIDKYMEGLPLAEKSYLYRKWIKGDPEALYGSCCVLQTQKESTKIVYQATFTAMLIYDISRGNDSAHLNSFYGIDVEEIQEKLRDNTLWLLCGMEKTLEVRNFYYHLKENCQADNEQIKSVDNALKKASHCIFSLVANLKFRSKLGELVRSLKSMYPKADDHPGEASIKKLEMAGIHSIKDLVGKKIEDLTAIGLTTPHASQIVDYIKRRLK